MNHSNLLENLLHAVNSHDLDALVACFATDYVNETPVHPERGFRGREQVRRNWTQIFAGVPDIHADVPRTAIDGDTLWTEWELSGTRVDDGAFLMRGVVVFTVAGGLARSSRFYLEPVETVSGDVDAATQRLVGTPDPKEGS
ncbi:Ketosteroid isomerase-related protein [Actinokineospora alba]|uniref:Ketosteroid isomerase-related protein n=1 Tax=Actinokineospora alba TaxID=504798 RepID=A0A1H0HRS7_9PSEU|nr:nuclear transport factor 2 family protein [Actinokineospora alba]TDP64773.1 ketosteroid isomerase-like protein [Actinokineospora alba]SDH45654.1 Ketosteroid isomerase-related protein [Actinokineospora alba]SDO21882.1 Ketosteroid isomerase-related protein [Actinokineospora alba]